MTDLAKETVERIAALIQRAEAEGRYWTVSHGLHEDCLGGIVDRPVLEREATEVVTLRFASHATNRA